MFKLLTATFLAIFLLISLCHPVQAASSFKGEVLNIDASNRIIFTDLSNKHLNKGDLVEIHDGEDFITYLEVIETKDTSSRLGVVSRKGLATKPEDFASIGIGAQVIKAAKGNRYENTDALLSQISKTESSNESLKEQLRHEKILNQTIEQENIFYQQRIEKLNETISSLESNLQNVTRILDEKIQNYQ